MSNEDSVNLYFITGYPEDAAGLIITQQETQDIASLRTDIHETL